MKKKQSRHDPILFKYKDDSKIVVTINRPTENKALYHIASKTVPYNKDIKIYHTELKLIMAGCDPSYVHTKVANELSLPENEVIKSLKRMEKYLRYKDFYS